MIAFETVSRLLEATPLRRPLRTMQIACMSELPLLALAVIAII
jgi:hypothetical protein